MRKEIFAFAICACCAVLYGSAYTTAIYTNELWSVRYRGPDTPVDFRPSSVASIGENNPWDFVWFFPSRPNPWGLFYQYPFDARWICWRSDGRDPLRPATIGAPPHRYSYYRVSLIASLNY